MAANNSAAAMGEQGGQIRFIIQSPASHILIEVHDNGPGIPDSIRETIFDPYVTTKDVGEGMGLGLAISKKIMMDHGGDLELLHTSEQGTTFGVYLQPVKKEHTHA